jgi:deoxycytidylate deaminase
MRWYNLALKFAQKSPHTKHKMGAVIIRGGAVLSVGFNSKSTPFGCDKSSRHAEERAIQIHGDYEGGTIVVARTNNSMSRPCHKCLYKIRQAGISKIVYAGWDGALIEERV